MYTKRELKRTAGIIRQIARDNHVTEEEARRDMKVFEGSHGGWEKQSRPGSPGEVGRFRVCRGRVEAGGVHFVDELTDTRGVPLLKIFLYSHIMYLVKVVGGLA